MRLVPSHPSHVNAPESWGHSPSHTAALRAKSTSSAEHRISENRALDDPQVKEAIIKALEFPTQAYKEGFVPPTAINWNDADNNNALHAKTIVMDLDDTISSRLRSSRRRITTISPRWVWRRATTAKRFPPLLHISAA
jgi:hypothetical protein